MASIENSEKLPSGLEFLKIDSKYAYHLVLPCTLRDRSRPLNCLVFAHGSTVGSYHDIIEKTTEAARQITGFCDANSIVGIVPVMPRREEENSTPLLDAQMLSASVMMQNYDPFYFRPDLDLIRTLRKIQVGFQKNGYRTPERVMIAGFSAGASFALRFAMLHPEMVSAVAIASLGNYIYPETERDGISLPFPFGLSDVRMLEYATADKQQFFRLPFYIFDGMKDTNLQNDPINIEAKAVNSEFAQIIRKQLGNSNYERFLSYVDYLLAHGVNVTFGTDPSVGHRLNDDITQRMFTFLSSHRQYKV